MSTSSCFGFTYRVWQRRKPIMEVSPLSPHDEIPIEFRITKVHGVQKFICADDDDPVSSSLEKLPLHSETVSVPEDAALLPDGGVRLRSVLRTMEVGHEYVDRISSDISRVAQLRFPGGFLSSIVVALVHIVAVIVLEVDDESESEPEYVSESDFDSSMDTVAATKSSIATLEKIILEEGGMGKYCMICIEEYEGGMEITRMPCSHIFHGDCIVIWLLTSHLCPLCRYPMPSSD
ncbi:RING-H2 finger protein ATL7-like [Juglans microcarpa x Juglans regia]|uniref:RING-H2 finger protein ATL7-like n=1 Tax=Juglans microcarpa x Juglans regia TaxID=2249226 RepID=UPI001B7F2654|nr:RING-H2 finger protein ATL7-like [Juglans microcarpa x Juglans regia]